MKTVSKKHSNSTTHYETFKRQLAKRFDAICQLIENAVPYTNIDEVAAANIKEDCYIEIENLKEVITESMGEILGD